MMDTLNHAMCMHTARLNMVRFYTRLASSYAQRADSYTCRLGFTQGGRVLMLVGKFVHYLWKFYTRRASSYACWQVRTLPLASRWYYALNMKHSQVSSLPSAHTTPMDSKPLFQECLVPWALPTNITMCCNVSIPCSNVYGMSGNTTLTSLLP